MNKIILTFLLSVLFSTAESQTEICGTYKYTSLIEEKLLFNYILTLNCDKTFLAKDSTFDFKITGTWAMNENGELILTIDPSETHKNRSAKSRTATYFIRDGQLREDILSKREYRKFNKITRKRPSCFPNSRKQDTYNEYKQEQQNRYLAKIENFSCR